MIMTAKYPGVCSASGARIRPGDRIEWNRKTKKAVLVADNDCDDNMTREERAVLTSPVSHVYRFASGAIGYRNKRGLCEDAPCCGCCTF